MTITEYFKRLIENSREKYILITEILRLTNAQKEVLNEEGMETLESYINEKQIILDKLTTLDDEFQVYFKRLKTTLGVKSLEELDENFLKAFIAAQSNPNTLQTLGNVPFNSQKDELSLSEVISHAKQLKNIISDINEMIKQISQIEVENNEVAKNLLDVFATEVRKINKSKTASSAYQPGGGMIKPPSYFIDSKK